MSNRVKSIGVTLGLSLFFTIVFVVGIQLVLASQYSKTQPAKQDDVQVVYPDNAEYVSTTITQPQESTPIEFTDEKDTSEDQQKRKQHLSRLQRDRLQVIEEEAAQKRQQVEESYLQRCRELQIRTETKIRSLGPQEKIAWAELKQDSEHKTTNTQESTLAVGNTTPDKHAIGYSISERVSKTNVVNDPAQESAIEGQRITRQENKTLASYKRERAHLQNRQRRVVRRLSPGPHRRLAGLARDRAGGAGCRRRHARRASPPLARAPRLL